MARKQLLVEGPGDRHFVEAVTALHGVSWTYPREHSAVFIPNDPHARGRPHLLKSVTISTGIKNHEAFGIVVDADEHPAQATYDGMRADWPKIVADADWLEAKDLLEPLLPSDGVVVTANGKRFGVWIMPDNSSAGALEELAWKCIPESRAPLRAHASALPEAAEQANVGADFAAGQASRRNLRLRKAQLQCYLGLSKPPGLQAGSAVGAKEKNSLDGTAEAVAPFVAWFKKLFELT